MKTVKFAFTALAVFTIVGGALAFKTAGARNLLLCDNPSNPPAGHCILQTATNFSSQQLGNPVPRPQGNVYIDNGTTSVGAICASSDCQVLPAGVPIYNNASH